MDLDRISAATIIPPTPPDIKSKPINFVFALKKRKLNYAKLWF